MQLFGRRRKAAIATEASKLRLVDDMHQKLTRLCDEFTTVVGIGSRIREIERDLRQVQLQLDFMRTRISCYVGNGTALTYLADETPVFVNADDMGGPFNLLNGGRYEEENVEVLLSFLKEDSVFLDIGANLGLYTLRVGRRLGRNGKIYAFEPHPRLAELLRRNTYINGLTEKVTCFQLALSDQNTKATLQYPFGHLGGGHIDTGAAMSDHTPIESDVRRLDDLLGADFRCDLVKIDVEGHEHRVLNGMRRVLANSPDAKILFEKLTPNVGTEPAIEACLSDLDFDLYGVLPDARLAALGPGELSGWGGYVLAGRRAAIDGQLSRSRFSISGGQLIVPGSGPGPCGPLRRTAERGQVLFHGPYWFLRQGVWRCRFHGEVRGALLIAILERFGHRVLEFPIDERKTEHVLVVPRDVVYFECAAYATSPQAEVTLDCVEFVREG